MQKTQQRGVMLTGLLFALATGALADAQNQTTRSTGNVTLELNGFHDLDENETGTRAEADIRFIAGPNGEGRMIEPLNGTGMGVMAGNRRLYETCAANLDDLPASRLNTAVLTDRTYICLRTSGDRVAVFKLNESPSDTAGALVFGFTVWERPAEAPRQPDNNSIIRNPGTVIAAPDADDRSEPDEDRPDADPATDQGTRNGGEQDETGDESDADPVAPPSKDDDKEPTIVMTPTPDIGSGSDGPNLPDGAIMLNTITLECPDAETVSNDAAFRTGRNEAGWDTYAQPDGPSGSGMFSSTNRGLYLLRANLSDDSETLQCEYADIIRVDHSYQVRRPAAPAEGHPFPYLADVTTSLGTDGFGFTLSKTATGTCTPVDSEEWNSDGTCIGRPEDRISPLCPSDLFYNGPGIGCFPATTATCAVTCPGILSPE